MEHYFAFETPQQANGSTSTAAADTEGNSENSSEHSQSAATDGGLSVPMESQSKSMDDFCSQEDSAGNASPEAAADPRFRLGIETGRRFKGSCGTVYELLDSVGSGSASTVYKCKKVRNKGVPRISDSPGISDNASLLNEQEELLAVKAIDLKGLKLNRSFTHEMDKLRREAHYLRTLRHPGIVRFIDYVETSDAIFIVQEYLKGGELFYKIVEKGCLSEQQACFIAHQMLAAIVFMHNSKIIHRDIKPENILIHDEVEDGFYRVKVADFGLAKTLASCGTFAKTMVGTPQYWAPEVINCGAGNVLGSYGYEADIWSFGVCLYVFLGGTYPFDGATSAIQQLVLNGRFHFRHSRFSRVSEDAKDLIRRALVVDQNRRITEKEIFYHPWMTRWLCDVDRSRFHLTLGNSTAFRFMPPLPPLSPPNGSYPPCNWHPEKQRSNSPRRHGPSDLALDPAGGRDARCAEVTGGSSRERSAAGAVELLGDGPDSPGVAVGTMLPGFVKTNEPIPPFHLPLLLPLQLHLLLSVHLLLLSLRESQANLLLAQKLQRELWSLQRCVHTAVGFFEVTATSAIEAVIDISSVFDSSEERESGCDAVEAVGELFNQIRRWTCEMQKQGERLGARYERVEASVSDLICCMVSAVSSPVANLQQQGEQQPQDLLLKSDLLDVKAAPLRDTATKAVSPRDQHASASNSGSYPLPPDGHPRALVSPVSFPNEGNAAKDAAFSDNVIGLWGSTGSVARMDLLREFLASNLRHMLYSFAHVQRDGGPPRGPPTSPHREEEAPLSSDDRQQVDAGVQAWSQVGMPDPSIVTDEILDFLFLSTTTAASHARQMKQSSEKPGECFSVNGPETAASRRTSAGNVSTCNADAPTPHRQPMHADSAPGGSKPTDYPNQSPAGGLEEKSGSRMSENRAELSFLCDEDACSNSLANTKLQEKIAVSRQQLRSLEKLRQVSYILTCVCSFWSNFDVILCRLLQLQQITETLTKHARAAWAQKRASKRLGHLKECWFKFRTQCRIYLQLSNERNAKLMDLGFQVQMRADQLDAIKALRGMPG